jgi:hypothetical protein
MVKGIDVTVVHRRNCRAWRMGKSKGPCTCPAEAAQKDLEGRVREAVQTLELPGIGWVSVTLSVERT